MESLSNDNSSQPLDPATAFRAAKDAQARMAARVRSPWWVHLLRGLCVAVVVFGLSGYPDSSAWALLGVVGLITLSRWRTRTIGVSRANTERWRFLTLGAPWSTIAFAVTVAAMVFVVANRAAPLWQIGAAAVAAAVFTLALGPVADRAARSRMADDLGTTRS